MQNGIFVWFLLLTLLAVIIAFQHYYIYVSNTDVEFTLTWHLLFNLFYWWLWIPFYILVRLLISKYKPANQILYWSIYYLLLPVILVSLHQFIAAWVITTVLDYSELWKLVINRILNSQWVWVDLVLYFIITVGLNIYKLQERSSNISIRNSQLQYQLYNTQFELLKNQIKPHFLFNTLNTMSTLILKKHKKEAQRMLNLLSRILRKSVFENPSTKITLSEEMKFILDYLEIEQVRYGDKMELRIDISEETKNALVPNLILQPLVENAIQYGIALNMNKGIIAISSISGTGTLQVSVEDSGSGLKYYSSDLIKKGLGIRITEERLLNNYPGAGELKFSESELGGIKAEISIPFEINNYSYDHINKT